MSWWSEATSADLSSVGAYDWGQSKTSRKGDWTRFSAIPREERHKRELIAAMMRGERVPSMGFYGLQRRKVVGVPIPPHCPVVDLWSPLESIWFTSRYDIVSDEVAAIALGVPLLYVQTYISLLDLRDIKLVTRVISGDKEFRHAFFNRYRIHEMKEDLEDAGVPLVPPHEYSWSSVIGQTYWLARLHSRSKMDLKSVQQFASDHLAGLDPFTGEPLETKVWHVPEGAKKFSGKGKQIKKGRMSKRLEARLRQPSRRGGSGISRDSLPTYFAFRRRVERLSRLSSIFRSESDGS